MSLNIDSWLFTRILGNNPHAIKTALSIWAFAWKSGEPTDDQIEEYMNQYVLDAHPYQMMGALAEACGADLCEGGQHVPEFLRQLADQIESKQRSAMVKMLAEEGPETVQSMGDVLVRYAFEVRHEATILPLKVNGAMTRDWREAMAAPLKTDPATE